MKVQFFSNRGFWRVREKRSPSFSHGLKHIEKHIDLEYGGVGWDLEKPSNDADFILIHANKKFPIFPGRNYTEDELKWKQYSGKKVLLFDEMWNRIWVKKKIKNTGATHIIGFYNIEKENYRERELDFDFEKWAVVPHCAETSLYKDYGEKKTIDILFAAATSSHYIFRRQILQLLREKLSKLCSVKIVVREEREESCFLEEYARQINRSKITICTSSNFKYRLTKYAEIPLCNSLMAGDVPECEDSKNLEKMMCVLHPTMADDEIIQKLLSYLKNDELRKEKIEFGARYSKKHFSQEEYAQKFVKVLEDWNR